MNKKIILSIVVGLLIIGISSATLVTYLSNRAEATITITSPMSTRVSEDKSSWTNSISLSGFGGETKTIYLKTENKANVTISGISNNKISGTGAGCSDFTSVKVTVQSNVAPIGETELMPANCINGTDEVELNFGADSWSAYRKDNTTIKITFSPSTVGSYVFESQVKIP